MAKKKAEVTEEVVETVEETVEAGTVTEEEPVEEVAEETVEEAPVEETEPEAVEEAIEEEVAEEEPAGEEIVEEEPAEAEPIEEPVEEEIAEEPAEEPVEEEIEEANPVKVAVEETGTIKKTEDNYVEVTAERAVLEDGGIMFDNLEPIFETSVSRKPRKYVQGPVYVVDGIISVGRIRVSSDEEHKDILGWASANAVQGK